jgi:hypothetical protein
LLDKADRDIELLLTLLYQLNEYFVKPRHRSTFDDRLVSDILESSVLPAFFPAACERQIAMDVLKMLQVLSAENDQADVALSPHNFLLLFEGAMREYCHASIKRQPCPLHSRLFEQIEPGDCVASFNYDEIADYALLRLGKLSQLSFEDLGFESINLPDGSSVFGPRIKFLKIHGGLNWLAQTRDNSNLSEPWLPGMEGLRLGRAGGPEVHYCLGLTEVPTWAGNICHGVILPFHCKDIIYRTVPVFARHMRAFRNALTNADEIWLIGKNFENSDRELNGMVKWATWGRERVLHIIDPNIDAKFHCSLFNSKLGKRYQTFAEYAST